MENKVKYSYIGIFIDFLREIFYNRNKKGGSTYDHS